MLRHQSHILMRIGSAAVITGFAAFDAGAQRTDVQWLLERSWDLINEAPDSALYYADVAAELARADGDSARLALAFRRIAICHERERRLEEGLRYLEAAWGIDDRMGNDRALVSNEQKIGALLSASGRHAEAISTLERALERARRIQDDVSIARCLNQLALAHQSIGHYDEGVRHVFEAMRIRKRQGDEEGVGTCLNTLAGLYMHMKRHGLAEQAMQEYIGLQRAAGRQRELAIGLMNLGMLYHRIDRDEEMLACVDTALAIYRGIGDGMGELAAVTARADALASLGRKDEARELYKDAIGMAEEAGDEEGWAMATLSMAELMPSTDDAERLFREVLAWSRETGNSAVELDATNALAECLRAQGRAVEALELFKRAQELQESMFNLSTSEAFALADSRERYDASLREERIKELQLEVALREEQRRRRTYERNALVIASVGLLALVLLVLRTMQQRKRIARQKEDLHRRQVKALLNEQEVVALESMLEGQRRERGRIAQDLHDRLGSALSAIRMRLSAMAEDGASGAPISGASMTKVVGMADHAVGEVRRIAHDMADTSLAKSGFAVALESLRDRLHQPGRLEVELSVHGLDQRVDQRLEIVLYKVVQELVANVLKHAGAQRLSMSAMHADGVLAVMVEDDGVGFPMSAAQGGLGLAGIRRRLHEVDGVVRWDSRVGRGTTVVVEVPLSRASNGSSEP